MSKIFKDDIGTKIELDIDPYGTAGVQDGDITSAKILVTKPSGAEVEWSATVDGKVVYHLTEAGDLDQEGDYVVQAYVELSSGWKGRGEKSTMSVYD